MAELKDTYVVHEATTTCSMGMRPSSLVLRHTHGVYLKGQPQMTAEDCRGGVHVLCFGGCYSMENPDTARVAEEIREEVKEAAPDTFLDKVMNRFTKNKKKEAEPAEDVPRVVGICTPCIPRGQGWSDKKEDVRLKGGKPAMGGAKLHCIYGGEIEIVHPGQPEAGGEG